MPHGLPVSLLERLGDQTAVPVREDLPLNRPRLLKWNSCHVPLLPASTVLLREQLDDQLFLHRDLDVLPDWKPPYRTLLVRGIQLEPRGSGRPAGCQIVGNTLLHLGALPEPNDLSYSDDVGRHRDLAPIHLNVAVGHHLSALAPRGRHSQAEHHIVQAPLQELQEIFARHTLLSVGPGEVTAELRL